MDQKGNKTARARRAGWYGGASQGAQSVGDSVKDGPAAAGSGTPQAALSRITSFTLPASCFKEKGLGRK